MKSSGNERGFDGWPSYASHLTVAWYQSCSWRTYTQLLAMELLLFSGWKRDYREHTAKSVYFRFSFQTSSAPRMTCSGEGGNNHAYMLKLERQAHRKERKTNESLTPVKTFYFDMHCKNNSALLKWVIGLGCDILYHFHFYSSSSIH